MEKNSLMQPDWTLLPRPEDDGAASHLPGRALPDIALTSTAGAPVNLASLCDLVIIFAYPMTGPADATLPKGWDDIPGARGCTPQTCAFRDLYAEFSRYDVAQLFGLSTQAPEEQAEAAARLNLPYPLLSDKTGEVRNALRLPAFELEGKIYLKRMTLAIQDGMIEKIFYPVFPPDENAAEVLNWLAQR